MIWLISDLHGGEDVCGLEKYLSFCGKSDILIILGDLGLRFRDTELCRRFSASFESLPCRVAFIDGNHENFDYLDSLPVERRCGGKVHRVSNTVVHLMRGQVFEIEGKTFFTMGGCKSTQKWKDAGLWWPQEDRIEREISEAYRNLRVYGDKVDYILTHKYEMKEPEAAPDTLQGLFNHIENSVEFSHWYSGHWHRSERIDDRHTVVYQQPVWLLSKEQ